MTDEKMKQQGRHVGLAESVVNTTRWAELEEKIESSQSNTFNNSRQRKVFYELLCVLRTEYECIKHDYYENKFTSRSLLAWRARNLLEINTWCRFCCEEKENAEEFFKWAGEDQLELEKELEKWGEVTDQSPEWFEKIERTRQDIYDQAKKRGVSDLKAKYKSPAEAAKAIGHDKDFKIHNKILSKFAHPTPMVVLSAELENGMPKRAFYFFSQGCLFFYDAFFRLETFMEDSEKEAA